MQKDSLTRSTVLENWLRMFRMKDVIIVNLQYRSSQKEIASFNEKYQTNIIDFNIDLYEDVEDIFAILSHCNMVVSVPNSTIHFAALMGVPSWIVCPQPAPWQWRQQGTKSMWYDHVNIFRQVIPGSWKEPIDMICMQLANILHKNS